MLASIDVALEHAELFAADDDQMGLFLDESFSIKPKYVETEELPLVDLLAFEKETLGIYFSNHPLSAFRKQLTAQGAVSILQAQRAVKRRAFTRRSAVEDQNDSDENRSKHGVFNAQ
nr:hypothetical protein [Bacillus subtilis]